MKQSSLFIKIYLGFLLTLIVTAGTFFYLERLIIAKPIIKEWHSALDKIVQFHAEESAAIYNLAGAKEAQTYFARLEKATGIKAYLFNEKGVEVTGRTAPDKIRRLVLSDAGGTNAPPPGMINDDIKLRTINIPGKPPLTFAVKLPHPGPPGPPSAIMRDVLPGPPPGMEPPPNRPIQQILLPFPGMHPNIFPPISLIRLLVWLIVSAGICYLLARYLTTPIFKLGHAARQLADGNLSVRVSPALGRRRDELSALANDFDGMAERIENLLTSQRNLLRDVSHELRSPLARLNVALELCRQNLSSEEAKHLDRIALETERLNELIGQILAYNKITIGAVDIEKSKFDLATLIEEVAADSNYEAKSSRVAIGSNESFLIDGNFDYLRRALENIIRNALYHTPEKSLIEVSTVQMTEKNKSLVRIIVRDHGRGVPEDALPLIFKPFVKIAAETHNKTGAGLGLAISEAAVRLHHGEINARNAEDGGLIVEITLPVAHPDRP